MIESSVRKFAGYVDAVLSQNFIQQGCNLRQSNKTSLYETGDQLDVANRCTVNFRSAIIIASFIPDRFR